MATELVTLEGGNKLDGALLAILKKLDVGELKVGFMDGATYPDGTPVAAVAFWNEFGTGTMPARPFFRRMIAKEAPTWGAKLGRLVQATGNDGQRSLSMLGEDIKAALQQSITELTSPVLSPKTIKQKGFAKPLIDTGHMKDSVTYKVEK